MATGRLAKGSFWRNLKNGLRYEILGHALNKTNANDDQIMVVYRATGGMMLMYVREENEFKEKFEICC